MNRRPLLLLLSVWAIFIVLTPVIVGLWMNELLPGALVTLVATIYFCIGYLTGQRQR